MWKTGLQSITTSGRTVKFNFKGTPNYQDWDTNMYSIPIVPRHIWSSYSATEIVTGNTDKKFVGTGPFTYGAGKGASQTLQWNRRDGWWATKAVGMRMPMKYIVDIHNTPNTASLQNFLQNKIDLSNNFFPGIDKQIGGKVRTYYPKAPYMLSANTAWLVPNTTKKPLDDRVFRRALADVDQHRPDRQGRLREHRREGGSDRPAADVGQWIDKAQSKKLGFTYNIARAKALLAGAGYKDTNGDGFVENKDGSSINLRIIVPNGWSDWQTAIQIIANSTKAAGIKLTPAYPDFNGLVDERNSGKFDLVINNEKQLGNTPYTYYDYLFHLPIAETADVRQLRAIHGCRPEAVGVDARAEQGRRRRTWRRRRRSTRRSRSTSSRSCPRFRSGTTGYGRSTTPASGPTSRAHPVRGCRPRPRCGTATST